MPEIYATATDLAMGGTVRILGPFASHHAARAAVVEFVGQTLIWKRVNTGAYVVEREPIIWVVQPREESRSPNDEKWASPFPST